MRRDVMRHRMGDCAWPSGLPNAPFTWGMNAREATMDGYAGGDGRGGRPGVSRRRHLLFLQTPSSRAEVYGSASLHARPGQGTWGAAGQTAAGNTNLAASSRQE